MTTKYGMLTVKADSLILPADCPVVGDLGQAGTASYTDEFVLLMGSWCHKLETFYDSTIYIPVTSYNVLKQLEAIELVESQLEKTKKPDAEDLTAILEAEDRAYLMQLRESFDAARSLDPSISDEEREEDSYLRRELAASGHTDFEEGWFKRWLRSEDSTYKKNRPSLGGFQTGTGSTFTGTGRYPLYDADEEYAWEYPHHVSQYTARTPAAQMTGVNLAPDFRGMDEADAI